MDVGCGPIALLPAAIVAIAGVLFVPDQAWSEGPTGPVIVEEVTPSP
jgi:hypothetical protein